jgi:alpha-tubulin suppressor-like RCC1 family protein
MVFRKGSRAASWLLVLVVILVGCGDDGGAKPAITEFSFDPAANGFGGDVATTIDGTSITVTVPFGTDVTALKASFSTSPDVVVTVNGVVQVSGVTTNDFTEPVQFRVAPSGGAAIIYTVTVLLGPSPAKDLTAFAFRAADNPGLATDVTATIVGTTIAATVPNGTTVTGLVASFATTGDLVQVGSVTQASGVTANGFSGPVVYRVTAADASTKDYTVTVTVAAASSAEITAFGFRAVHNLGLAADVVATINASTISATVPFGTDVTALQATFSATGVSVTVGGVAQVSDVTGNNFTSSVVYRVTAADTTTRDYTVIVTIAPSPAKNLTSFAFLSANNPALSANVTATITGTAIAATVPFGTNVTALKATFATTGMTVAVSGTTQVSGVTPNNFTSPVTYRVTAADGSTKDYVVTITVAFGGAKDLTAFSFRSVDNAGLASDVTASIVGTSITATVPSGTNVTALKATFSTSGVMVMVGATQQLSGMTANDFTSPVIYRVVAQDSSTQDYTVTITVAPSGAKSITSFVLRAVDNAALAFDAVGLVEGNHVDVTVPRGTNVSALVATFTTDGVSVTIGGVTQTSGMTPNNFTTSLTYRVTAANASTADYLVTVNTGGATKLVGGQRHVCAIVNGGVKCWGDNSSFQLGNGTNIASSLPVQVVGLTHGVQHLATASNNTCAVVNGAVSCWGETYGASPVPIAGLESGVQAVAVGNYFGCALANGGVRCWGENIEGQLGNGTTTNSAVPVQVVGLTSGVQAISAGWGSACAVVRGSLVCWGSNGNGQLGNNSTVNSAMPVQVVGLTSGATALDAGSDHVCAIVNGSAKCWGAGAGLGNGTGQSSNVPQQVVGMTSGVQAVTASNSPGARSCVIRNGAALCFGSNLSGQLGNPGAGLASTTPVQVLGLEAGVEDIAAASAVTCAIVNGDVVCTGQNQFGAVGDNTTTTREMMVHVVGLRGSVPAITTGASHSCAIVNGGAQCWGRNTFGQLGNSSTTNSAIPVHVANLASGVQQIATGTQHSCALVNGGVRCWGRNNVGQLGNTTTTDSNVPVQVMGLTSGVQHIAVGADHTCALANGAILCWGGNARGQLGDTTTTNRSSPAATTITANASAIAAGVSRSCAIVDGAAKCWGANSNGELGDNSRVDSSTPVSTGLTSAQAVSVGANHTCAVVDGAAKCWGDTFFGQLGGGVMGGDDTTDVLVPSSVSGLTSEVQAITAGAFHTCALVNGGMRCWGYNEYGQLGDNSTTNRSTPVAVFGLSDGVQTIAAGAYHTCALVDVGPRVWGWNVEGAIGNGTQTQSNVPVVPSGWAP